MLEPEANDSATFTPSLTSQIAAGTPPDAAPADWNQSLDWASDGLLLPLDDLLKARRVNPDEWFQGAMDYTRLGGKAYGLPITGYTTVVYYNRDLFQREGVPLPPKDGSWRWRDLEALAVRLTRRDPADPQHSRWGLLPSNAVSGGLASAVWQNGGTLTDVREAPARMTVDQPAAVEAISWLTDLSLKHRVGPTAEERRALGGDPFVMGQGGHAVGRAAALLQHHVPGHRLHLGPRPGPPRPGRHPGGGDADQRLRHLQGDEARRRGLHPDLLLHRRRRGQGAGGDSAGGGGPQADVAGGVDEGAAAGEPAGPDR